MKIKNSIKLLSVSFALILLSLSAQAMDRCFVGNWKADKTPLKQFFSQASAQVFSNPNGDIRMSLKLNGAGQYQIDSLKRSQNNSTS